MRTVDKILTGAAIAGGALLAAGTFALRRSLPKVAGRTQVEGIGGAIEIIRDVDAVAHIYADTLRDVYFGQGYVHAQDRLWQMEYQRRLGHGRLSEILGTKSLPIDRYVRTIGVSRLVDRDWQSYPTDYKDLIQGYVDGTNALIRSIGNRLPPEFLVLGCKPEPWTGPDVLVWAKVMAWNLSRNNSIELLRRDVAATVGWDRVDEFLPGYPEDGSTTIVGTSPSDGDPVTSYSGDAVADTIEAVRDAIPSSDAGGSGLGSNAWVVSSTRSTTGKPILANDPHLATAIPSTWYLMHLCAGPLDVIGASIPGLPSIIIGRNRRVAWGVTAMVPDTQDLYRERLDPTGTLAEFEGAAEPVAERVEVIQVKGEVDHRQRVRVTRHGPIITDSADSPKAVEPLAFRWTALDPGDTSVIAFFKLNLAGNWIEFNTAMRDFVTPPQNFLYADVDGNIGYLAPGRVPIRKSGDGAAPAEGWTGAAEWIGDIPFDDLPRILNPDGGAIASANNRPAAKGPYLGRDWEPPHRIGRILERLADKEAFTPGEVADIQADTVSGYARIVVRAILPMLEEHDRSGSPDLEAAAVRLLQVWDFDMRPGSAAAVVWAALARRLPRALSGDIFPDDIMKRWERLFFLSSTYVVSRVSSPDQPCIDAVRNAFSEAVADVAGLLGPDTRTWRWDSLHRVLFPHQPFTHIPVLKRFADRSVVFGGDTSTVCVGPIAMRDTFNQEVAAGYRQVIDLSDVDGGRFIHAPGQSGHLFSPHYSDYLADWQQIRYRQMRLSRRAVEAGRRHTLILQPREEF